MNRSPFTQTAVGIALLLASAAMPLQGQELPWLRGGQIRFDVAPSFWAWDSRFGSSVDADGAAVEGTEPLGMELDADPLGSGPFTLLQNLETDLREALQDDTYGIRLGAGQSLVEQSRLTLPLRLDVGITDWLTVGAMVPFHRPRIEMDFLLDSDSTNANVGLSPLLSSPSQVANFVGDFQSVLDAAQQLDPDNPSLLQARSYLMALGAAYSQGTVFPMAGSQAGSTLQTRLDEIRSDLEAQGYTGIPAELPLADTYLDSEGFNALLASRGMQAFPLEDYTHFWSMGDVEFTVEARLFHHGFTPDSLGRLPRFRFQAGIGALLRLGTGQQADPNRFFDLDPADGQRDLEGSVFGLVEYGRRLGAWGRVRYGIQQEGSVVRRIAAPQEVIPDVFRRVPLFWTPGNYLDLELNPRFYFTPEMTFGVRYHLWHKGQDAYTLQPIDPEILDQLDLPPTELLEMDTEQTLHELALSATYSTRDANDRGETPMPLMVRFTYFHPMAGSGGRTPNGGRLQVGLTLFRTLWGGNGQGRTPERGGSDRP